MVIVGACSVWSEFDLMYDLCILCSGVRCLPVCRMLVSVVFTDFVVCVLHF